MVSTRRLPDGVFFGGGGGDKDPRVNMRQDLPVIVLHVAPEVPSDYDGFVGAIIQRVLADATQGLEPGMIRDLEEGARPSLLAPEERLLEHFGRLLDIVVSGREELEEHDARRGVGVVRGVELNPPHLFPLNLLQNSR